MAVIYAPAVKAARMEAVRTFLHGGALELLSGVGTRLASIRLPTPFGYVDGATLEANLTEGAFGEAQGRATSARLVDSNGNPVISGLTVGKTGDVKLDTADITRGQVITINSIAFTHA